MRPGGVAAAVCLAAALLAGCGSGGSGDSGNSVATPAAGSAGAGTDANAPARSPSTTDPLAASDASGEEVAAVTDLTSRRLVALAAKDRDAWLSTVADPHDAFGVEQGAVFDRMSQLPIGDLVLRGSTVGPAGVGGAVHQTGSVARLKIGYELVGYDRGERTFDVGYAVVKGAQGWRFTGLASDQTAAQPWDLAGMNVARSGGSLVVGDQPPAVLQAYATMAETGRTRVAGVWGSAVPAVLVAPKTTDELVRLLGRTSASGLDQVAAVTDGPLAPGGPAVGDRVYVNPTAFASLSTTGRQVVVTHELTHVTIRATTSRPVPIWLSEGFADFVGFTGSGLPTATVAADLLDRVRRGTGPTSLPTAADFDPTKGTISPTYNAAWLAVTRIAQIHGQAAAVAFYRSVAGGTVPDPTVSGSPDTLTSQAFVSVLGTTQDAFVADWQAYLKGLAR